MTAPAVVYPFQLIYDVLEPADTETQKRDFKNENQKGKYDYRYDVEWDGHSTYSIPLRQPPAKPLPFHDTPD